MSIGDRKKLQTKIDQTLILTMLTETIKLGENSGIEQDVTSILNLIDTWIANSKETIQDLKDELQC